MVWMSESRSVMARVMRAPDIAALDISTSLKSAPVSSASRSTVWVRLAPVRSTPIRLAFDKSAWLRLASRSFARDKSAPFSIAPGRAA